jgi:hypothetical protein
MREAGPRGHAAAGTSGDNTFLPAIVVLLLIGLALRLIIAYVLLPGSGFPNDLGSFEGWSNSLASHGTVGFYSGAGFLDYPPVYLLFLTVLGMVFAPLGGVGDMAVKLIPIFADLALAYVVALLAVDLGASRRRAMIAAAVVIFNPITWFNSAIWGQADAVGSVFMVLGLQALLRDRRELASVLAVVAALTKIQLGILGFLVGFVVLRRSLFPRQGHADPARVVTSVAAGLGAGALACLPFTGLDYAGLASRWATLSFALTALAAVVTGAGVFLWARRAAIFEGLDRGLAGLGLGALAAIVIAGQVFDDIVSHIINTFGEYPYLTLNAYNPWALVSDQAGNAMARDLAWVHDAPWTGDGQSFAGVSVGPFSGLVSVAALLMALVLISLAFLAWQWARSLDDEAGENPEPEAEPAEPGAKPRLSGAMDLRAVAVACVVGVAAIAFVFGGQLAGPLSAALVGDGLLIATLLGVSVWAAWRDDRLSIAVALAILAIAFFVVPTRAHERYLFPFFAVGAALLAVSWRWTAAYVALAIVNTANLMAVLPQYCGIPSNVAYDCLGMPAPLKGSQAISSLLIDWGNFLRDARYGDYIWPIALSAVVTGLALLWALAQMRGRAVQVLAWEASRAGGELPGGELPAATRAAPATVPALPSTTGGPAAGRAQGRVRGSSTGVAAMLSTAEGTRPAGQAGFAEEGFAEEGFADEGDWAPGEPEFVPAVVMRAWRWLYQPPVRPDRSAALASEPRGRLDKLDLWLVVLLVAVVLSMRIYRLGEPREMHFDEVYHARSATEFLQDWRYGLPHDIYEWTHPMLAKYAIAAGITIFSDDKVATTAQLGVPVKDVVVQPRAVPQTASPGGLTGPQNDPNARLGDRVFVATGSAVQVYDLETRALVWSYQIPGVVALSMAADTGYIYAGSSDGEIWRIDTNSLDNVRLGVEAEPDKAVQLAETGVAITRLYAGSPPYILAVTAAGDIVSVDGTGKIVGRGNVPGAADFAPLGTSPATVSYVPGQVTSPTAEASFLAGVAGGDASQIQALLSAAGPSGVPVRLDLGTLDQAQVSQIQTAIDGNELPGISLDTTTPQVMVAYENGVGSMNVRDVYLTSTIALSHPATSIAINTNTSQDSYVAAGNSVTLFKVDQASGTITLEGNQTLDPMPAEIDKVVFDDSTKLVQALGRTPDGKGWTVYAIETNGNAVFSDAVLPWQPVAIGLDGTSQLPAFDRQQLLAFAPDGSMAVVDVGQFAFSWRIVGVLFGALMMVCLYLITRLLFRRRSIALLVALFSSIDGMFFVQSRIAMNDTYVGGLMMLGYLIFVLLWLNGDRGGRRRWLAFWIGMPILGVVMGLALASKWVALYAIGSMGTLILARSALGRILAILGLAAGTGILGWDAIHEMQYGKGGDTFIVLLLIALALAAIAIGAYFVRTRARTVPDKWLFAGITALVAGVLLFESLSSYPPSDQNGSPNYTFFLIMFAATMIAAAANAYHPVAWTRREMWFGILAPAVLGVVVALVLGSVAALGVLTISTRYLLAILFGGPVLGAAAGGIFYLAGLAGFGPLAAPPPPDDPSAFAEPAPPAPKGWLNLGSGFGLPAAWMGLCLLVVPIVVYIAMYVPWSRPWQPETDASGPLPVLMCWHTDPDSGSCTNAFPAGHTGQTLYDLTIAMYNYHNDLRAAHAASSPWWAWPLDLKPVWFESDSYGLNTGSMIYDGGNPLTWWLAIAAMAFVCWQAFKRKSLGLALVAAAFFWQWLSWARIDRASFQYHFYTALPFFLMGLAYFMAELWHGPSRRTWLLARVGAAAVLLIPPLLWLGKAPLCELARVDTSQYWQQTACLSTQGNLVVEVRMFWIGVVLVAALGWLLFTLVRLERTAEEGSEGFGWAVQLVVPVIVAGLLLMWIGANGPRQTLFQVPVSPDMVVPILLLLFIFLALVALATRDPRRFVVGYSAAAVIAFVVLYPNLSALVMPGNLTSSYNGFLPTWLYGFQFSVNQQISVPTAFVSEPGLLLAAFVMGMAALVAYAAWVRRVVVGYRRHLAVVAGLDGAAGGDGPGSGQAG